MKKEKWITFLLCGVFIVLAGILYLLRGDKNQTETLPGETASSEWGMEEGETGAAPVETGMLSCVVDICGAVRKPGVYRFAGNARVCDAVEAAGGFKQSAATDAVNQARYLTDGEQIKIPTKNQMRASDKKSQKKGTPASQVLVNINEADASELTELTGIGEAKAQMIIEYRTENGPFQRKEDIMKISGIKEGIYNQIKDEITV